MEKPLRNEGSANSRTKKLRSTTSIWTKKDLLKRLARGREARTKFVESQIKNGLVFQIRALRAREGWSQPRLADEIETSQNQIYRLENPAASKPTITTLKKIAAAFDVALVVRFVPFSQLVDWVSGTPFVDRGLSTEALAVSSFAQEMASAMPAKESAELVAQTPIIENVYTLKIAMGGVQVSNVSATVVTIKDDELIKALPSRAPIAASSHLQIAAAGGW